MAGEDFEFDAALSFLERDEKLALRISDLLQNRMRVFVYSEAQKELAARDGADVFSAVFAKEARVVVILYREDWGQTKWTRIEETAIRGRAFEHGFDFTLFVNLDPGKPMPDWLSKTRIWANLDRFGEAGLVSVIDQLVKERGGTPVAETLN